jgi:hypothetical protein
LALTPRQRERGEKGCGKLHAINRGTFSWFRRLLVEQSTRWRNNMGKGLLLWLIGIPLPIILVIWLFGGLH